MEWASAGPAAPGTSPNKGTPDELVASLARDCHLLVIIPSSFGVSATITDAVMDILVGGATEDILIPDLLCGGSGATTFMFPVFIPAGTRVSARVASTRTSVSMVVACKFYNFAGNPPFKVGSKVVTYGITAPDGTAITPGASGAEGSYTEIVAATSEDHFAVVPSFQVNSDTTQNARRLRIDVGMGAATEDDVGTDWLFMTTTSERAGGFFWPAFKNIPSGTRLAMRASNSASNDGGYTGALHCVSR